MAPPAPVHRAIGRHDTLVRVITSERPTAWQAGARAGLSMASWLYRAGVTMRNRLYDWHILQPGGVPAPVISIGNLTTGGTGKTPMVQWLARRICALGYQPAVLCRGYGAPGTRHDAHSSADRPGNVNDEALLLQATLERVPVIVGADRLLSARIALRQLSPQPECFILDDGFQHRRMKRDLDILLIDSLSPFGHGFLLPRGFLREPVSEARRADIIVLTRADLVSEDARRALARQVKKMGGDAPVLATAYNCSEIVQLDDFAPVGRGWLANQRILAFSGIGNPESFHHSLKSLGLDLAVIIDYPDHHWYTEHDIDFILSQARELGVSALMTTQKDAMRLQGRSRPGIPLLCLQMEVVFLEGEDVLAQRIKELLPEERAPLGTMSSQELSNDISLEGRPEEPLPGP